MKVDGGCHCGRVTYEAQVDPTKVGICHCTDCQSLTGSAYRVTVSAARTDVRLTGDSPKEYVKTGDNGRKRLQYFCPECGSPLFTTGENEDAGVWGIRWGSINQRHELTPGSQIWLHSAAPWVGDIGKLPGRSTE